MTLGCFDETQWISLMLFLKQKAYSYFVNNFKGYFRKNLIHSLFILYKSYSSFVNKFGEQVYVFLILKSLLFFCEQGLKSIKVLKSIHIFCKQVLIFIFLNAINKSYSVTSLVKKTTWLMFALMKPDEQVLCYFDKKKLIWKFNLTFQIF